VENEQQVPDVAEQEPIATPEAETPQTETPQEEAKEERQETETEKRLRKERNRNLREKYQAQAEAKRYKEEAEQLRQQQQGRTAQQPAELNPMQFASDAEYQRASIQQEARAAARAELEQERNAEKQRSEQQEAQKAREGFSRKLEDARDSYPDFEEVVSEASSMPVSPALERALTLADNGADILYHLAKNPEEVERINRLRPVEAAFAVAQLAHKIQRPTTKASNAPTPIKPVAPARTSPSGEPDVSNEKAWLAWRTNQVRKLNSAR